MTQFKSRKFWIIDCKPHDELLAFTEARIAANKLINDQR